MAVPINTSANERGPSPDPKARAPQIHGMTVEYPGRQMQILERSSERYRGRKTDIDTLSRCGVSRHSLLEGLRILAEYADTRATLSEATQASSKPLVVSVADVQNQIRRLGRAMPPVLELTNQAEVLRQLIKSRYAHRLSPSGIVIDSAGPVRLLDSEDTAGVAIGANLSRLSAIVLDMLGDRP